MNISDWFTQQFLIQSVANNPGLRDKVGTALLEGNTSFADVLSTFVSELEQGNNMGPLQQTLTPPSIDDQRSSLPITPFVDSISSGPSSPSDLNDTLGGVLKGKGSIFEYAGKQYGIDPKLLAAISMHETGNGTSNAVRNKNNVGGMMGSHGLQNFKSLEDGIFAMAGNLKRNYFDQGLDTIPEIQKKYAPVGATNDPTGLNQYWVSAVSKYYKQMNT